MGDAYWRPNLFIAGFAKCGTTELCSLLSQHADIFLPWEKEPNTFYFLDKYPAYLSGDRTGNTGHSVIKFIQYQKMYESAADFRYRIDATSSYAFDRRFARLLKSLFPDAKVMLVLRDQKQRLISTYFHSYIAHREADFAKWLSDYFVPFIDSYLYYDKLQAYHEAFGEDLRVIETRNLGSEITHRQLFRFLGIEPVSVNVKHKNANYLGPGDHRLYRDTVAGLGSALLKCMQLSKRMGVEHQFNRMIYAADESVRGLATNNRKKNDRAYSEMLDMIPRNVASMLDEDYSRSIESAAQNDTLLVRTK